MAVVLPPARREHWVSKLDKKLSLIPVIGAATNLTKLFAKLFFKVLENLLPPVYRPLKSLRIVRAITNKKIGTYIFQSIPFWFVLKAMSDIGLKQEQQDIQRRQAIAANTQNYLNARLAPSLQRAEDAKQNWDLFLKSSAEFRCFTSEFGSKTDELHQLKWNDPQKFELESQINKQLIETSLQKAKANLNDLTTVYNFHNMQSTLITFQKSILTAFGERIALYYPDISSPPLYLKQSDPFESEIMDAWKQRLPRMSEKPLSLALEALKV